METRAHTLLAFIDELQRVERLLGAHADQNHTLAVTTRDRISASLVRMEKSRTKSRGRPEYPRSRKTA